MSYSASDSSLFTQKVGYTTGGSGFVSFEQSVGDIVRVEIDQNLIEGSDSAFSLKITSSDAPVIVGNSPPPTPGQILIAQAPGNAVWQDLTTINNDLTINGNLTVTGTTTTVDIVNETTDSRFIYCNSNPSVASSSGGLVVHTFATATAALSGNFVAGVDGVSDASVGTGGAFIIAGTFVQIQGSVSNDGIYEVASTDGSNMYVRSTPGLTTPLTNYVQTNFVAEAAAGTWCAINQTVLEALDTGRLEMVRGSNANLRQRSNVLTSKYTGDSGSLALGPHVEYRTTTDLHPVRHDLNFAHGNVTTGYDMYYTDIGWLSSDAVSNFAMQKYADYLSVYAGQGIPAGSLTTALTDANSYGTYWFADGAVSNVKNFADESDYFDSGAVTISSALGETFATRLTASSASFTARHLGSLITFPSGAYGHIRLVVSSTVVEIDRDNTVSSQPFRVYFDATIVGNHSIRTSDLLLANEPTETDPGIVHTRIRNGDISITGGLDADNIEFSTAAGDSLAITGTATTGRALVGIPHAGGQTRFQLSGASGSYLYGPNTNVFMAGAAAPVRQTLNFAANNINDSINCYWNGSGWRGAEVGAAFRQKYYLNNYDFDRGTVIDPALALSFNTALRIPQTGNVQVLSTGFEVRSSIPSCNLTSVTGAVSYKQDRASSTTDINSTYNAAFSSPNWVMQGSGGAFQIHKGSDTLTFRRSNALTGSNITWDTAMTIPSSGTVQVNTALQVSNILVAQNGIQATLPTSSSTSLTPVLIDGVGNMYRYSPNAIDSKIRTLIEDFNVSDFKKITPERQPLPLDIEIINGVLALAGKEFYQEFVVFLYDLINNTPSPVPYAIITSNYAWMMKATNIDELVIGDTRVGGLGIITGEVWTHTYVISRPFFACRDGAGTGFDCLFEVLYTVSSAPCEILLGLHWGDPHSLLVTEPPRDAIGFRSGLGFIDPVQHQLYGNVAGVSATENTSLPFVNGVVYRYRITYDDTYPDLRMVITNTNNSATYSANIPSGYGSWPLVSTMIGKKFHPFIWVQEGHGSSDLVVIKKIAITTTDS